MSYVRDYMRAQMAKHQLEPVDAGSVPMFWLKEPGQFCYSLLITEMPVMGMCLTGDLQLGPGRAGPVMAAGYDLRWFASNLDEGYLCSKFLREEWSLDAAERDVFRRIKDLRADSIRGAADHDEIRKWVKVARAIKDGGIWDANTLADALHADGHDLACDYWPGYGYHEGSAGWLCAAQQRFRELWAERQSEGEAA